MGVQVETHDPHGLLAGYYDMKETIQWNPPSSPPEYEARAGGNGFICIMIQLRDDSVWAGDYTNGQFCVMGLPVDISKVACWSNYPRGIQYAPLELEKVPPEIDEAAETLFTFFEKAGVRDWQFSHVADRRLVWKLESQLKEANAPRPPQE